MRKTGLVPALLLILVIASPSAVAARVTGPFLNEQEYSCVIYFSGEVDQNSIQPLIEALQATTSDGRRNCVPNVIVDSLGGDVEAAMKLGRLVRDALARVEVSKDATCASACVFILAGGVQRLPLDGRVLIHRPYSTFTGTRTMAEVRKDRERLRSEIVQFLQEVDVPLSLLDLMESVPPELSRELTTAELQFYRLSGTDATYKEQLDAYGAARLGVSREEYVNMRARCEGIWSAGPPSAERLSEYSGCLADIRNGPKPR